MKLFIILLLFTTGCWSESHNKDVEQPRLYTDTVSKQIVGKWVLCQIVSDSSSISYNICPKYQFFANGTGKIVPAEGEYSFRWIIEKDKLIFSFDSKADEERFFSLETSLYFTIAQNEKPIVLELTPSNKAYKAILAKQNVD